MFESFIIKSLGILNIPGRERLWTYGIDFDLKPGDPSYDMTTDYLFL